MKRAQTIKVRVPRHEPARPTTSAGPATPAGPAEPAGPGTVADPGKLVGPGKTLVISSPTARFKIIRDALATITDRWENYQRARVHMPRPARHSRLIHAPLCLFIAVDESCSTLSTDGLNWRWWAVRRVGRWMHRYHPDDRIVMATFDDAAYVGTARPPLKVARDPDQGLPKPKGGTAYNPVIDAALAHFAKHPNFTYGIVLITDGMASDAEAAAQRLRSLDLHAVIVPFGSEWQQLEDSTWNGLEVLRIYEHPGAYTKQIARSVALGVMSFTGETVKR